MNVKLNRYCNNTQRSFDRDKIYSNLIKENDDPLSLQQSTLHFLIFPLGNYEKFTQLTQKEKFSFFKPLKDHSSMKINSFYLHPSFAFDSSRTVDNKSTSISRKVTKEAKPLRLSLNSHLTNIIKKKNKEISSLKAEVNLMKKFYKKGSNVEYETNCDSPKSYIYYNTVTVDSKRTYRANFFNKKSPKKIKLSLNKNAKLKIKQKIFSDNISDVNIDKEKKEVKSFEEIKKDFELIRERMKKLLSAIYK